MEGLTSKSSLKDQTSGLRAWAESPKTSTISKHSRDGSTLPRKSTFMDESVNFTKRRIEKKRDKQESISVKLKIEDEHSVSNTLKSNNEGAIKKTEVQRGRKVKLKAEIAKSRSSPSKESSGKRKRSSSDTHKRKQLIEQLDYSQEERIVKKERKHLVKQHHHSGEKPVRKERIVEAKTHSSKYVEKRKTTTYYEYHEHDQRAVDRCSDNEQTFHSETRRVIDTKKKKHTRKRYSSESSVPDSPRRSRTKHSTRRSRSITATSTTSSDSESEGRGGGGCCESPPRRETARKSSSSSSRRVISRSSSSTTSKGKRRRTTSASKRTTESERRSRSSTSSKRKSRKRTPSESSSSSEDSGSSSDSSTSSSSTSSSSSERSPTPSPKKKKKKRTIKVNVSSRSFDESNLRHAAKPERKKKKREDLQRCNLKFMKEFDDLEESIRQKRRSARTDADSAQKKARKQSPTINRRLNNTTGSWDLESSKYSNELKSDDRDRHYDKRRSYHVSSQSSYKRKQEEISFNTKPTSPKQAKFEPSYIIPEEFKSYLDPLSDDMRLSNARTQLCSQMTSDVKFIDTHCHIDFLFRKMRYNKSYDDYINECFYKFPPNYGGCISIWCDPSLYYTAPKILRGGRNDVWGAFGCHPHFVKKYTDSVEKQIEFHINSYDKVIAWGEMGLDYADRWGATDHDLQIKIFGRQLQKAVRYNLPLVIHCRDAEQDLLKVMKQYVPHDTKIHRHCVTVGPEEVSPLLDYFPNCMVGFTNVINDYSPRAKAACRSVEQIPLDRIIMETDAPYFLPGFLRNEFTSHNWSHPGMASAVACRIANLKGESLDEVLLQTSENVVQLYGVP